MNKWLEAALIFIGGAGTGVIATRSFFKYRYYKDFEKEVEEIRDIYERRLEKEKEQLKEQEPIKEPVYDGTTDIFGNGVDYAVEALKLYGSSVDNAVKALEPYGSTTMEGKEEQVEVKNSNKDPDVYIIAPEEFAETDEFDTASMILFADGVLIDDAKDVVDMPENFLGSEWKAYLDEAQAAYFRNLDLSLEIEVIRDIRTYDEFLSS